MVIYLFAFAPAPKEGRSESRPSFGVYRL
jgi:hypothetical protein